MNKLFIFFGLWLLISFTTAAPSAPIQQPALIITAQDGRTYSLDAKYTQPQHHVGNRDRIIQIQNVQAEYTTESTILIRCRKSANSYRVVGNYSYAHNESWKGVYTHASDRTWKNTSSEQVSLELIDKICSL